MKIDKPCYKLKYCPYGPLVEKFPIGEAEAKKAEELGYYITEKDGSKFPDLNRVIVEFGYLTPDISCSVFGHDCPVFTCNEPFIDDRKT